MSAAFANRDKKEGEALTNQNRIKWTLDVNTELKALQDVTITDALPEHLTLDPATLKVNKLDVSEGDVTAGDAVNVANAGGNTDLSLNLGNITGAYRITFETIIDASILSKDFTNTAQFNGKAISSNVVKYDNSVTVVKKNTTTAGKIPGNTTGDEITISPDNRQEWEIYINETNPKMIQ
ncbi:MAG: collagen binding domain-containing protein, partial [Caryophanon sp.]|nr:collagen binding domain-containing protein [Caryophanon sp.]